MSQDLGPIFEGWEFVPGQVTVRQITGDDGYPKIQLRLDMGLLQMELDGRPDGTRPMGHESLFHMYQSLARDFLEKESDEPRFTLDAEDCAKLQQEAVQYYHRYLALFQLGDWVRVIRDTRRNLDLFDFVEQYAETKPLAWLFQQFRPYGLMMLTRARAQHALEQQATAQALAHVTAGIREIRAFYERMDRTDLIEQSQEIHFLENWEKDLQKASPENEQIRLEKALAAAVEREDYETAAQLRDSLKQLKGASKTA